MHSGHETKKPRTHTHTLRNTWANGLNMKKNTFGLQHNKVIRKDAKIALDSNHIECFIKPLITELSKRFTDITPPNCTDELLDFFIEHEPENPEEFIQNLFFCIRSTLYIEKQKLAEDQLKPAIHAATNLYMIAAYRAVNFIDFEQQVILAEKPNYIIKAPLPTRPTPGDINYESRLTTHPARNKLICGIISSAIYGGKVEFTTTPAYSNIPDIVGIYEIPGPNAGIDYIGSLESNLYAQVFKEIADAPKIAQESQPLPDDLREELLAELRDIKEIRGHCLAIIINDHSNDPRTYLQWTDKHRIPVLLPSTEQTASLLHITPDALISQLKLFWKQIGDTPISDPPPSPDKKNDSTEQNNLKSHITLARQALEKDPSISKQDKIKIEEFLDKLDSLSKTKATSATTIDKSIPSRMGTISKTIKEGTVLAKALKDAYETLLTFLQ